MRQGRAPLPYALSELIDNALRATQDVQGARRIAITFATAGGTGAGASGLIAVWDNGAVARRAARQVLRAWLAACGAC